MILLLWMKPSNGTPSAGTIAAKLERTSTLKGATRVRTFNA